MRNILKILLLNLLVYTSVFSQNYYQVDTLDEDRTKSIRLKIPEGVEEVEGILMMGNPWEGSTLFFVDDTIGTAYAKSINFVMMGTSLWGRFKHMEEFEIFEYLIDSLAIMSGHPEISDAPFIIFGCSNGGQMAHSYNTLRPEKCIAFLVDKGGYYINPIPDTSALKTPGLLVAGDQDLQYRIDAINDLFYDNRPRGALWSHILAQNTGHVRVTETHNMFLILSQAAYELRYPADQRPVNGPVQLRDVIAADGWLSDSTTWDKGIIDVFDFNSYSNNRDSASWHINKDLAYCFAAHSSYNRITRLAKISDKVVDSGDIVNYEFKITKQWDSIIMYNRSNKIGAYYSSTDTIFDFDYELSKTGFNAIFSKVYLSSGDSSVTNLGVVFVNGEIEPILTTNDNHPEEKADLINVFPNPSNGVINIEFQDYGPKTIMVYKISGELILEEVCYNSPHKLSLKSKGIYLISVISGNSNTTKKVIIK